MLVPSCMQQDSSKASLPLKNLRINGSEEQLLAELAETIIPATTTPGAKDMYLHQFALKMVDDCHGPDDRKAFEQGLKAFDKFARERYSKSFTELSTAQRAELLQQLESGNEAPEAAAEFYKTVKGLTVQGYLTSKHYLSKVQVYELVPGRFRGCVPLSEATQPSVRPA